MRPARTLFFGGWLLLAAALQASPVGADEYAFYAAQERTGVISRFLGAGLVLDAPDFWVRPVEGVSAREALHAATLRRLARLRVLQALGCEAGLLERPLTHAELLARGAEENARRAAMKARGEVFYGPVAFREDRFLKLWSDRLFAALVAHHAAAATVPEAERYGHRDRVRRAFAARVEEQTKVLAAEWLAAAASGTN